LAHTNDPRRRLPAVDTLMRAAALQEATAALSAETVAACVRETLADARAALASGKAAPCGKELAEEVIRRLAPLRAPTIRRVINATGIILHTGLGRAPLAAEAANAVREACGYCSLEFNLESGERGERQSHVEELLCRLSGAEAALTVNNNAAALYLTLNVLGYRREVIVSRGQLIEIGGSFRLPDIMARSGAKLVEVGTTNRTRLSDYRSAITPKTALLLHCHTSNYRIVGFTESVPVDKLVKLGRERGVPVVDDIGNGLLWDWSSLGLPSEVNARASLEAGADLVLMSGDKALGGPQAGIILGRRPLVEALRKNPLARVLRPEKLMLAGLSATLRLHLDWRRVAERVPVWRMLTCPLPVLRQRAERLRKRLAPLTAWQVLEVRDSEAETGSGTLPAVTIPSIALCTLPRGWSAAKWAQKLRAGDLPIIGSVREDMLWLDLRTVSEEDEDDLVRSVERVLREKL
jgi:L-seryl-tRNA(Ser) seleniumtransferase